MCGGVCVRLLRAPERLVATCDSAGDQLCVPGVCSRSLPSSILCPTETDLPTPGEPAPWDILALKNADWIKDPAGGRLGL